MKSQRILTYEQWKVLYKKELRKTFKHKAEQIIVYIMAVMLFLLPIWMFLDWLLRGY